MTSNTHFNNIKSTQNDKILLKLLVLIEIKNINEIISINTFDDKKIKILYTTFYPNEIIIEELLNLLSNLKLNIEIIKVDNFQEFIHLKKDEFDIILHLITPSLKDKNSLFKFSKKHTLTDEEIFNLLFLKTNYLPIFMGRSIFLKKEFLEITMDELGQIKYEEIFWRD